jgi:hypothetical protein
MIPDRIKELVEQFREHRDFYKSTDFKEHQFEQDYINQNRTLLERQIAATDREIDKLVYELYGF